MRKIRKLSFEELNEQISVISHENLNSIVGGDGFDGYCLFFALAYLSGGQHDVSYYVNAYGKTYGYGAVSPNSSGYVSGPSSQNAQSFVIGQFTASSLNPNGGVESFLAGGGQVLTDISNGDGTSHAVVITHVNSITGTYTYYDPMNDVVGTTNQIGASMLYGIN